MLRALGTLVLLAALAGAGFVAMNVTLRAIEAVGSGPGPRDLPPPRFVEQARDAGVEHRYDGEFEHFVGGGVAAFDCNDDGRSELFFAGGTLPAALYRNDSAIGGPLAFSRVESEVTDVTAVAGAYPLDVDSDGLVDLAVLRVGENVLLRGLGGCAFERANETWGVDGGDDWTVGFSATWEGSATLPTLGFGNYVDLTERQEGFTSCSDSALVRPDESGTRFAPPVALTPGYCTLSILFSDWNRSGRRDLRMTNDRHYYRDGEEQLWRIEPGEEPRLYTREDGWEKLQIWGMGIASRDLTGDGRPEVFLTSQADNKLQTLRAGATGPAYEDIAFRRRVTAHRPFAGGDTRPSTAWHPEFADVNNDGYLDLFIAKGNVEAQEEFAMRDPSNLLLGQRDGTFSDAAAAAGVLDYDSARGAALVDLNLDGLLDLVRVDRRENVKLWRNVGAGSAEEPAPMGGWVALGVRQSGSNRDAIGSWVQVRSGDRMQEREVTVGGGHAGGQLGWLHFGIGSAGPLEVRVQWPDGETGPWQDVRTNAFSIVERGASGAEEWSPE